MSSQPKHSPMKRVKGEPVICERYRLILVLALRNSEIDQWKISCALQTEMGNSSYVPLQRHLKKMRSNSFLTPLMFSKSLSKLQLQLKHPWNKSDSTSTPIFMFRSNSDRGSCDSESSYWERIFSLISMMKLMEEPNISWSLSVPCNSCYISKDGDCTSSK